MKLDPGRLDNGFSKVAPWIAIPLVGYALIKPVIDGEWEFWVPFAILAGLAVMWTIQFRPHWLRGEELFIAVMAWVAVVISMSGIVVDEAYLEAVAQIIPVLFLALVVDRRLRVSGQPEIKSRMIVLSAYTMALAEYFSLRVVADNSTNGGDPFAVVTAGLVVAAIAVVLPALVEDDESARKPSAQ